MNKIPVGLGKNEQLCVGCRLCEAVCSAAYFKEKSRDKSSIRITEAADGNNKINFCTQCGFCLEICPVQAIYRDDNGIIRIREETCVGCYACVGFCPEEAMHYHPESPAPFKCSACGMCADNCPTGAIYLPAGEC